MGNKTACKQAMPPERNAIYCFKDELYFRCITDKWGNFTKGKIYKAEACMALAKKIKGKNVWTDFKIHEDDGDGYTIEWGDVRRKYFEVVRKNDT